MSASARTYSVKTDNDIRLSITFFAPKDTHVSIEAKITPSTAINLQDLRWLKEPEPVVPKQSCWTRCRRR